MNFKENLIELFAFTRGERKGIFVLLILLTGLIVYRYFAPWLQKPDNERLLPLRDKITSWASNHPKDSSHYENYSMHASDNKPIITGNMFPFDPNATGDEEWKQLGLNKGQIKSIRTFLSKGGKFKVKSDFAKMYVIGADDYRRLSPYILLPESLESKTDFNPEYPASGVSSQYSVKNQNFILEINSADSFDFRKLRGIGPFLSRKIVSYREKLGGYYAVDQLREIYRMDSLKLDSLQAQLLVDPSLIQKIHINTISANDLANHPYINKQQARALIAYRDHHGSFRVVADIRKSVLIDEKTYQKIAPYLSVD